MRYYTKPDPPVAGSMILNFFAGVAICDGFDTPALWFDADQSYTLTYPANATLKVTDGLPVDNNLTIPQLQSICTQLNLSTEGTQQELIDRIKDHLNIQY